MRTKGKKKGRQEQDTFHKKRKVWTTIRKEKEVSRQGLRIKK
jgi:hypothetical protein